LVVKDELEAINKEILKNSNLLRRFTMKRAFNISTIIFGTLLVMAMVFGTYAQQVFANPPEDLRLKIVETDGARLLEVTITHPSDNPTVEFIKSVEVKVNGSPYATYTYNRQPRKKTFTYAYEVPIDMGYTIEVTADSSMYGSRTAKLVVK
jgi:hypothetical protein